MAKVVVHLTVGEAHKFSKNEYTVLSYFSCVFHYPTLCSFSEFIIKNNIRIWIHPLIVWLGRIWLKYHSFNRASRWTVVVWYNTAFKWFWRMFYKLYRLSSSWPSNVFSPWTVNQMATPALKMNPARDMRICLLTQFLVHLMPSPTSAFLATWSQYICNRLEMLRYH